jgi:hypothetical protein
MTRAGSFIAVLFVLTASFVQAEQGEKVLVLPFRSVGVDDATVTAVRTILSGELEARGLRIIGGESVIPPSAGAGACDEMDCALREAEREGADRVVYGTLTRLGGTTAVRVHAVRAGSGAPYFRDQITAPTDAELPDLLGRIAGAIDAGRATAKPIEVSRLRMDAPRLAFAGGILLPISDSYGGETRLTSLRLYLHRERGDSYFDMGIPFAGIAWSGGFAPSDGEIRAVDWTIYDLFVGKRFAAKDRPLQFGLGIGLHRLDFSSRGYVHPAWKTTIVSCGDCGGAEGIALTGELGAGVDLLDTKEGVVTMSVRLRGALVPADLDDAKANSVLIQLGAIF